MCARAQFVLLGVRGNEIEEKRTQREETRFEENVGVKRLDGVVGLFEVSCRRVSKWHTYCREVQELHAGAMPAAERGLAGGVTGGLPGGL